MAKPDRKPPKKSTRSLRGKGPTPKAEDRPYHKKYRSKEDSARKRTERKRIDSKRGPKGDKKFAQRRDFRRNDREHVDTVAGIKEVERRAIENMTGIANHQGIALVVKPFQYSSQKEIFARAKDPALFIAVDGVTDPRNIGAIARSSAAFSADGLLIPERRNASLTAAAWKSSAGAAARLPIAQITNLARSVEDAKAYGCFIVGLDGDADTSVEEMEIADQPLYLIVGSEGKGLSRLIREKCDLLVSIPMSSAVESLNASVAVSIALYAVDRKRAIK